jgi:hypothetical protein
VTILSKSPGSTSRNESVQIFYGSRSRRLKNLWFLHTALKYGKWFKCLLEIHQISVLFKKSPPINPVNMRDYQHRYRLKNLDYNYMNISSDTFVNFTLSIPVKGGHNLYYCYNGCSLLKLDTFSLYCARRKGYSKRSAE